MGQKAGVFPEGGSEPGRGNGLRDENRGSEWGKEGRLGERREEARLSQHSAGRKTEAVCSPPLPLKDPLQAPMACLHCHVWHWQGVFKEANILSTESSLTYTGWPK